VPAREAVGFCRDRQALTTEIQMNDWLSKLSKNQRVLDLGSGPGSFSYTNWDCTIIALDTDFTALSRIAAARAAFAVNSRSHLLPFKDRTFDLIICNNTMEHFEQSRETLTEIGRILAPQGMLIVTLPNGFGFDDNLYRYLMEGGGHVNRFSFSEIVALVETLAAIRLVRWHDLYSSYVYLRKPAPSVLPHLRPRFRRIARLPAWAFRISQFALNLFTRFMGRFAGNDIAKYGWALFFARNDAQVQIQQPAAVNVCMRCGAGHNAVGLRDRRMLRVLYRCPSCGELNPFFRPRGMTI